jgi:hypothetical protein
LDFEYSIAMPTSKRKEAEESCEGTVRVPGSMEEKYYL